jgi:acyl-CoA dehydrogenase
MIDFGITEEQRALLETTRRYVHAQVRPRAAALDRAPGAAHGFDRELIGAGSGIGLGNLLVPERYGGYGGNLLDYALVVEELAWGDAGVALTFLVTMSMSRLILRGGTEAQRQHWLGAMCASSNFILAGPMTEPSGGSEIFCPLPDPALGVRTLARRDGDDYVIDGAKCYITSAGEADLYVVLARTDRGAPNLAGCSVLLVPPDTPGMSFGKTEDKMGHRLSMLREVRFDAARVPARNRLGAEGGGFQLLLDAYEGNGVGVGALAVGLARAAYDAALEYASQRVVWGQPIRAYESVAGKLADMRMKIEAARALVWKIAWAADNPERAGGLNKLGTMAKIYPASLVREIVSAAMDVYGAAGYMRDAPIEKYLRDAMIIPIYDGTNDLLKRFMAERLVEVPSAIE